MNAIRRHPKTVVAGAVVGVLALAGAAIAAIMLSSSLSGSATAETKRASDQLTSASIVSGSENDLDCNAWVKGDGESFVFNAKADRVVGEDGSAGNDTLDGSCKVKIALANTGDVALYVKDIQVDLPDGWSRTLVDTSNDASQPIDPGTTATATYEVQASDNAATGPITGEVVTSPSKS